jgi:redox-regulated HSP33 family molecular chaperone
VNGLDPGTDRNGLCLNGALVQAAGGWYVSLLPFPNEDAVAQLQKNLEAISHRSPTQMIRDGLSAEDILQLLLKDMAPQIMRRAVRLLASDGL